jgi:osmotically-inducible protein OsmY
MTEREREMTRPPDVELPGNMRAPSGFGANQISAGEIDRQPTDRRIHEEVCTILMDNAQVPIEQLDVAVAGGAVTLRGAARDDHTRRRAEELAAMIAGVKSVRNELNTAS